MSDDDEAYIPFVTKSSDSYSFSESKRGGSRRRRIAPLCCCLIIIAGLVLTAFGVGLGLGYLISARVNTPAAPVYPEPQSSTIREQICANPPVLQISLDGFWAGYFSRGLSPNLKLLADNGVRADYMRSQYPTKTFPNHFTIATGLFPEYHGIVDNIFYDRHLNESFHLSNQDQTDSKWWLGEPVWITAEKQGLISGVYFWPGSETNYSGYHPNYYFKYDGTVSFKTRVDTILSWFDLLNTTRPQYLAMYFSEPDHSGHKYGPFSKQVDDAISNVDSYLGLLIEGLKQRGIFDCVNVIITSDHGMASTPANQTILFPGDLPKGVSPLLRGTSVSLNVDPPAKPKEVYEMFKFENGSTFHPKVQVYYQWEAPVRFHVGHNLKWRYGDILLIPDVGWIISLGYHLAGNHGFDNNAEQMRAIFVAHGPAFQKGSVVQAFDNIEVYNLVCALLKVQPSSNNGTFGSLYHLLKPDVAAKLPPAHTHSPLPEKSASCPIPSAKQFNNLANMSCSDPPCTISYQARLNAAESLKLSSEQIAEIEKKILPWGIPMGGGGEEGSCVLPSPYSVTKYSFPLHIPLWSAYIIEGKTLGVRDGEGEARECFSHDPRVELAHSSNCSVSAGGFTAGQLLPADHLPSGNDAAKELSFLLTNAVPQHPAYKEGIGSYLSSKIRTWAQMHSTVYVVSGVVLDANNDGLRDSDSTYSQWTDHEGSAAVPSHFFMIATFCSLQDSPTPTACPVEDLKVVALLTINANTTVPQGKEEFYLMERLTTIREVETISGINFFPDLTVSEQNKLELRIVSNFTAFDIV